MMVVQRCLQSKTMGRQSASKRKILLCVCTVGFLVPFVVYIRQLPQRTLLSDLSSSEVVNFDGFNNETGVNYFLVPNIIHYVVFNKTEFSFVDYVCIRSAYVNHKPDFFYFHTNVPEFKGKFWDMIKHEEDLWTRVRILHAELPAEIFGQKLSEGWRLHHGSDVARIRLMMKYGGIYLDNDMFVVRNLDQYRKFEIVVGWDENQYLGSQVIIAHKDARFLKKWLDTYHEYRADLWYYNAGEKPTKEVLWKNPNLVHRVKLKFGVHMLIHNLFRSYWPKWVNQDAVHLLINHRSYLDPDYKTLSNFDENNIQNYNMTFGFMARSVYKEPAQYLG